MMCQSSEATSMVGSAVNTLTLTLFTGMHALLRSLTYRS